MCGRGHTTAERLLAPIVQRPVHAGRSYEPGRTDVLCHAQNEAGRLASITVRGGDRPHVRECHGAIRLRGVLPVASNEAVPMNLGPG